MLGLRGYFVLVFRQSIENCSVNQVNWNQIIREARKREPHTVIGLEDYHHHFLNLSEVQAIDTNAFPALNSPFLLALSNI